MTLKYIIGRGENRSIHCTRCYAVGPLDQESIKYW